ncbi:MAG TPA: hypothetical protein VIA09_01475, partial [Nitrososphaeraceae archaeon]
MGNLKKFGNNNHNTLGYMFAASIMVTLLTFGAFFNPLLALAIEVADDEEENRNVENSLTDGDELPSSTATLPIQSSQQQSLNAVIESSDSGVTNTNPFTQPSLQEQGSVPFIEGTTSTA